MVEAAARNPDGEALICGSERLTWREVARKSMQIAAGFKEIGLKPGDRSRCCSAIATSSCWSLFGAAHLGLVSVMLSTRQQKPEIAYVLNDCGAKLLIYEDDMADRLPDAAELPGLLHRVSISPTDGALAFQDLVATEIPPSPRLLMSRTPR
jgi:acyl-CoA synthetase (AMP-forming)/AMP-acid ligase II